MTTKFTALSVCVILQFHYFCMNKNQKVKVNCIKVFHIVISTLKENMNILYFLHSDYIIKRGLFNSNFVFKKNFTLVCKGLII